MLLSFAILLIPSACKKDKNVPREDKCYISANVDGRDYYWVLSESNCSFNNQKLQVGDIASDEAELTIDPVDGSGNYFTIDPDRDFTIFLTLGPANQIYIGDVEITISSLSSNETSGTFEGIFTDISGTIYQVANGEFRAEF